MTQEQFGTATPIYNKRHYNIRGQLYDVRASTLSLAAGEFDWNRGCLAFYYGGYGWGQSGPGNNGNLAGQQHWVPFDDTLSNYSYTQNNYAYDALNRLTSVSEVHGGPWGQSGTDYMQAYSYDRYGNRSIDQNNTSATVNRIPFDMNEAASTNRIYAPGDTALPMSQRQMRYDAAGNLNYDVYTGQGTRTFDAENRMKQAWANNQFQTYTYDGDGKRIKRNVNGTDTWQVYGLGGELLAEYPANGVPASPQKEYGYRNGELLISASSAVAGGGKISVASATASSVYQSYVPGNAIDGNVNTAWIAPAFVHLSKRGRDPLAFDLEQLAEAQTVSLGPRSRRSSRWACSTPSWTVRAR